MIDEGWRKGGKKERTSETNQIVFFKVDTFLDPNDLDLRKEKRLWKVHTDVAFRPIGLTFTMPLRNSMNVPLFTIMCISRRSG